MMYNISCWNVRGLNDPSKQRKVSKLISTKAMSVYGFVETKVLSKNVNKIRINFRRWWIMEMGGTSFTMERGTRALWFSLDGTLCSGISKPDINMIGNPLLSSIFWWQSWFYNILCLCIQLYSRKKKTLA